MYWRRRVDHHTRLRSEGPDVLKRAMQMDTGFLMHTDPVRSRIDKGWNEVVRPLDHQVNIQGHIDNLADRLHHRRSDRQVGDKMPIHYVEMQHGGPRRNSLADLFAQARKIGGKDGRSQFDQNRASRNSDCGNSSIVAVAAPFNMDLIPESGITVLTGAQVQQRRWKIEVVAESLLTSTTPHPHRHPTEVLRFRPIILLLLAFAVPAAATPKRPDLKEMLAQPQAKPDPYIPARAGWDGP